MKNTDRSFIGAIAGLIGGLILILYLQLIGLYYPATPRLILNVGMLFVSSSQLNSFGGLVISYTAHFIISALLGVFLINFFRITGRDWPITKGIIFGLAVWVVSSGAIANSLKLVTTKPSIPVAISGLTGHIIFGVTTSVATLYLSNKNKL